MSHASVTVRAELTWNLVSCAVHWETREEFNEVTGTGGSRRTVCLEELPAVGEEPQAVLEALGRELLALAAAMRGSSGG